MAQSRFVDASEYQVILQRVNQVICQFSNSPDKTGDAIIFMTRIEEKCTTREEFLAVIEKRLDLLSNPNKSQEYVDWFKSRRESLVGLLRGIKEKVGQDSTYLTKFSPSFSKGMQCLDKLLKTDVNSIGIQHMVDLTRIRKAVLELKGEIDNKAKAQEAAKSPVDPSALYLTLLETVNVFNAMNLETDKSKRTLLCDRISELKTALETHLTIHRDSLNTAALHRVCTAVQLLVELLKHHSEQQTPTEDSAPPLPLTVIHAVLSDLKIAEWHHVQSVLATSGVNSSSKVPSEPQEALQQLLKRRRTAVSISTAISIPNTPNSTTTSTSNSNTIAVSAVDQKLLDSLQAHQNTLETGTQQERIEHFVDQMSRNEDTFDLFEWDALLDINTHGGAALLRT